MIKDLVMEVASKMPDNATMDDILDAVVVRLNIKKGLKDIEEGKVIKHEDLLKEVKTW